MCGGYSGITAWGAATYAIPQACMVSTLEGGVLRIGLDVDGVFADFVLGFSEVMHDKVWEGCPVYRTANHQKWRFESTEKQYNETWDIISNDYMNWWMTLQSLVTPGTISKLNKITSDRNNYVYFLTSRKSLNLGLSAEIQTEQWLRGIGVVNPRVICTKSSTKAELINALDIEFFMDDKPSILEDAVKNCPNTLVSARDWWYNRKVEVDARYTDVEEALYSWTTQDS